MASAQPGKMCRSACSSVCKKRMHQPNEAHCMEHKPPCSTPCSPGPSYRPSWDVSWALPPHSRCHCSSNHLKRLTCPLTRHQNHQHSIYLTCLLLTGCHNNSWLHQLQHCTMLSELPSLTADRQLIYLIITSAASGTAELHAQHRLIRQPLPVWCSRSAHCCTY
jgi:hypothetical protein